ncbi:hypothetical protein [Clostridium thermosuccinogenes]|uniref:hypothetical protein n=1 Tax=Clostridium thermosuccinogenes TaxID=84032 RepID=UPI000CCC3C9B|nr:hypothetical protein [Pseudoclostridium thermosuccinogenes]PNT90989.1 hypothetical protein CDQ83_14270 [Pseudoclostridium thermosuccinogenes]
MKVYEEVKLKVREGIKTGRKEALCVDEWVESFKDRYEKIWWNTPVSMPELGEPMDKSMKRQKEKDADMWINALYGKLEKFPSQVEKRAAWQEEAIRIARSAGAEILGIKSPKLSDIIFGDFARVTGAFIEEASSFNPGIRPVDIMQAMRNVWIMNCMQVLMGIEVEYTPSIFAYSMLYPVTDNYMDDAGISPQSKWRISRNFRRKLSGEGKKPENEHEEQIFRLVDRIEKQYPRREFPYVYDSLLCIHKAQERSLEQQGKDLSPYESNILDISFEKGGTSVLADAFLVKGILSKGDADFIFGFGAILQMIDDLQDAERDMNNGHMTIFSQTAKRWKLDSITNRLLNFLHHHMKSWMYYVNISQHEMIRLIESNCILLIMEAIARNKKFFSQSYLKHIETYSPYSFAYLQNLENNLKKKYAKLEKRFRGISVDSILAQAVTPVYQ